MYRKHRFGWVSDFFPLLPCRSLPVYSVANLTPFVFQSSVLWPHPSGIWRKVKLASSPLPSTFSVHFNLIPIAILKHLNCLGKRQLNWDSFKTWADKKFFKVWIFIVFKKKKQHTHTLTLLRKFLQIFRLNNADMKQMYYQLFLQQKKKKKKRVGGAYSGCAEFCNSGCANLASHVQVPMDKGRRTLL